MMKPGQSVILPLVFVPSPTDNSAQAAVNSSKSTPELLRSEQTEEKRGLRTAHLATL